LGFLRFYIQIVFDLYVDSATLVPKKIVLHHIFKAFYFQESAVRLYQELQFCYVLVLVKIMAMSHVVIIMAFLY